MRLDHDPEKVLAVGDAGQKRGRDYRHDQILGEWRIAEPGRQHPVVVRVVF